MTGMKEIVKFGLGCFECYSSEVKRHENKREISGLGFFFILAAKEMIGSKYHSFTVF